MPAAQLSAAQLHEPILPLARPPQVVLSPSQTIDEVLRVIRASASANSIHYFYVVDADERLVGVVPTRRLLTSEPDRTVAEVMVDHVVAIPDWATVLIASEYFATRRLLAFPVVNAKGQLLGVVDVSLFTDEVIDLARRTYDDIFQLIGVHGTAQRSTVDAFKDRFPWLLCNIAGGLMAAFIVSRFEHLLQEMVVLALFIPIVLALGESVSMQALSLTLQSFTDGPFVPKRLIAALWKEFRTAAALGVGCGAVVAGVVIVWRGETVVAAVIFAAIALSMVVACLLGVAFPAILRVAKADPRIAAGPVVLAAVDVATLLFYFGIGARFLG
ncbi:MAG: magnesium transporter [Acidobacteria bacterium]|nr:magnesium transporter [Acidobacteriota bacterium]MSO61857.1 magnesium transporter [Acidobacteriota bacterium]